MSDHLNSNNKEVKCWELLHCDDASCPVHILKEDLRCWLISGTHCRNEIQGEFLEKMEMCLDCIVFRKNMDVASMRETMKVVAGQFKDYRHAITERDMEIESMSMELAIGIFEVFEALKKISSGDPEVRISETSPIDIISKLKHVVNLTAEEIGEIVNQSHEFAIVLAEQFDVLHRVSRGDLSARVSGESSVELLEALKNVTNETIVSIYKEITERRRAEEDLQRAGNELELRVEERTIELTMTNERLQQEIAERKRIEEALRKSEQKYRTVFENTGNPTILVDEDTTITMVNTKFEKICGYSKEEIEDIRSWPDFFEINDQNKMKEFHHMKRTDPNGTPPQCEGSFISKQGNVRDVILNFSVIPGSRKSVITLLDVTERKKLEEKMYQSDKLSSIGTLAAGVAHEINNPLAVILGFTDLLLEKVPAESEVYDILHTIYRQGNNAKRIVENLLSFVRFKEYQEEEVDVNKCIEAILVLEGNTFALNNISVNIDMALLLPKIKGDAGELQQVIFNIINNAVGSMKGEGGFLTITTGVINNNQNIEIRISDTGCGIKKESRKKIFDPLFTTKKVGEGTGLGLTVTYAIIKKHGGDITFETKTKEESDNPGTTFIITLPVIQQLSSKEFL
jgi:PAS domain S-box-containing protein